MTLIWVKFVKQKKGFLVLHQCPIIIVLTRLVHPTPGFAYPWPRQIRKKKKKRPWQFYWDTFILPSEAAMSPNNTEHYSYFTSFSFRHCADLAWAICFYYIVSVNLNYIHNTLLFHCMIAVRMMTKCIACFG